MELMREQVAMAEVVADCVSTMRVVAARKRISMNSVCDPRDMSITIDRARFKQILYNLLSNAVKFTPEDGHVNVEVLANQSRTVITVCDDGIGIDLEDQVMIFDEFRQVDPGPGHRQQGTGLGLALVRKLVELHGGTIHLESKPGEGSCFTIILPSG
jgi:signal transduction histidine kinase